MSVHTHWGTHGNPRVCGSSWTSPLSSQTGCSVSPLGCPAQELRRKSAGVPQPGSRDLTFHTWDGPKFASAREAGSNATGHCPELGTVFCLLWRNLRDEEPFQASSCYASRNAFVQVNETPVMGGLVRGWTLGPESPVEQNETLGNRDRRRKALLASLIHQLHSFVSTDSISAPRRH